MFRLQDPFSRLHSHHAAHFCNSQQQPQTSQSELAAHRLEEAKQRAIAAVRRPHQPTKLSQVQGVDDNGTDAAPTSPRTPCPSRRIKPGEGRNLFERTSFTKSAERNGGKERSLEDRVSCFASPTGPSAERGRAREREGGQDNRSAARERAPFAFVKEDVNRVETARNPGQWAAAATAATGLYNDAAAVAVKAAEISSPVPSPWKKDVATEEEYVPPPAVSPPPVATWSTQNHKEQQPRTSGFANTARPPPLNLGGNTLQTHSSQTTFHPLASAVWKTPQRASFIKPIRAPLPKVSFENTSKSQLLSAHAAVPRSVPINYAPTSQLQSSYNQPMYTAQLHTMPQLQHVHIAPTAALSINPPLTPPLSSSSSRPQLSTSVYLACLGAQIGGDAKVMLKCRMDICANRDGVSFGKDSLRNGVVERYRQAFGCGGCGEILDVVVC